MIGLYIVSQGDPKIIFTTSTLPVTTVCVNPNYLSINEWIIPKFHIL